MDLLVRLVEGEDRRISQAFTLIEILVVVAIISTLTTIAYFSMGRLQTSTDTLSSVDRLNAILRTQRIYAMLGNSVLKTKAMSQGVYFDEGKNTLSLFSCESSVDCTYDQLNLTNIQESLETTLIFSIVNLPHNQIVFTPLSGEVSNHNKNQNSITITNKVTNEQITIKISTIGTVSNSTQLYNVH